MLAGFVAGLAAGCADAVWSWRELDQFLPHAADKLRLVVFLAALYATVGAVVGPVVLGSFRLLAASRLGDLGRALRRADPIALWSLAIAGVPVTAAFVGGAFAISQSIGHNRRHLGLVVASTMTTTVGALVVGLAVAFAVARLLEPSLRRAAAGRGRRVLTSRARAGWFAVGLALAIAAAAAAYAWDTLSLLHLRTAWVGLFAFALAAPAASAGLGAAALVGRRRRWLAPALAAGVLAAGALALVGAGSSASVRKAAVAHTGAAPAIATVRSLGDWDRDGFSRWLGGGDCDDWDRTVHPGAPEIPDDGIDQNCLGGDASLVRDTSDLAFAPVPPGLPAKPNVLLITIDTLRADHLGAYGYERATSPRLDELAADGALFENAWAHAPSTRYSMPAILTGRYPLSVSYDMSVWWPALQKSETTIAERLSELGMYTGAILNYVYFDPVRRMNQGFDSYDNANKVLHARVGRDGPARTRGSSSAQQTNKAIDFLSRHDHEPFFLWVHYYDPHFQYERHDGLGPAADFGDRPIDLYDHEVRYTDHHIGRLIDDLKQRGLYDRTIIAVTGDHGEGFGEHGIDLHGYHLYAAQTRVPLLVRVPGVAPSRIQMPAAHVDLVPTLVNLLGGQPDLAMQGRSLVDVMTGAARADRSRVVYQQLSFENNNEQRGAASNLCHVIYNVSPNSSWEVYRIDEDPGETRDLADAPGVCQPVVDALETWYDQSEIPPDAAAALLAEPPADLSSSLGARLGRAVELVSVELPTEPVAPGDAFEVVYTFAGRGSLDRDWRVFAHFEAPHGGRFLGDHAPARPTSWWRDGQYIRYTRVVDVPDKAQPGDYVLWLGMFEGRDRLAVAAPARVRVQNDRIAAGVVEVAP